jgi:hypothetical protein
MSERTFINIQLPLELRSAVSQAAAAKFQTQADYVRQTLLQQVIEDGVQIGHKPSASS